MTVEERQERIVGLMVASGYNEELSRMLVDDYFMFGTNHNPEQDDHGLSADYVDGWILGQCESKLDAISGFERERREATKWTRPYLKSLKGLWRTLSRS